MPRGRHRHEQPLHRILPPAAVAAVALACAGGAWLVGEAGLGDTDTVVLRALVAVAAVTAVTGAVLAHRWDRKAGRRLFELRTRRARAEWRAEERQAELEAEVEEAREAGAALQKRLTALEQELTAKQAALGNLRNEHAALLRRYAHAETQRARALEGRRRLELEAAEPTRALTVGATDHRSASGAPTPLTYLQAREALKHLKRSAERQRRLRALGAGDGVDEGARLPGVATTPEPPSRSAPAQRPGGGFDFFGFRKSSPGTVRQPGAAPAPGSDASSGGDSGPDPDPAAPVRPPRAAGNVVGPGAGVDALDITELRGAIS